MLSSSFEARKVIVVGVGGGRGGTLNSYEEEEGPLHFLSLHLTAVESWTSTLAVTVRDSSQEMMKNLLILNHKT